MGPRSQHLVLLWRWLLDEVVYRCGHRSREQIISRRLEVSQGRICLLEPRITKARQSGKLRLDLVDCVLLEGVRLSRIIEELTRPGTAEGLGDSVIARFREFDEHAVQLGRPRAFPIVGKVPWFLSFGLTVDLANALLGDLHERHHQRVLLHGRFRAGIDYFDQFGRSVLVALANGLRHRRIRWYLLDWRFTALPAVLGMTSWGCAAILRTPEVMSPKTALLLGFNILMLVGSLLRREGIL